MDIRQNPLWLGFSLGRWFRTEVRVSYLFIFVLIVFCSRLNVELGVWMTALLFFSILLHEFGHVFAARWSGGSGQEILMWPLGGLAFVTPGPGFASEFWTVAAGPLTNALICLATLPAVLASGQLNACLNPLYLPSVALQETLIRDLLLLMFSLNFTLLLLNLLPIFPLDGGQMTFSVAKLRWDRHTARVGTMWVGMVCCILVTFGGVMTDTMQPVFVGSLLFLFCMHEHMTAQFSRQFDDSFMGYDFSQGYTSLEDEVGRDAPPQPGALARWKQQRDEKRREKETQQRLETERRVDELLDKVHQHGIDSLTPEERRFLTQASSRYRGQG